MYLKSLVLKGFKSFADRSALSLEPGITAIVGPNGSGKSNISDAVLWVLGERNAKNLRGQAMEDVIFAGSSARKGAALAEVDLVLDNSCGTLPVDYTEVVVTRRMHRSGESEYLINGAPARRLDVLDILHDSGLGSGTHSIISQGNLDSVLASKPEDRRALIEEAAGVLKHKQRKAKSERKLANMDQHLARVRDVVGEVERQLGPLERKARRARTFEELSGQLAEARLALSVDDLRRLQELWGTQEKQEEALGASVEEARASVEAADAAMEQLQAAIAEESLSTGSLSSQFRAVSLAFERLESAGRSAAERRRAAQVRVDEIELLISQHAQQQESLIAEVKTAQDTLDAGRVAVVEANEAVARLEAERKAASAKRQEKEEQQRSATASMRETEAQLASVRRRLSQTREALSAGVAHIKVVEGRRSDRELSCVTATADAQALSQEAAALERARIDAAAEESRLREALGLALQQRDACRTASEEARAAVLDYEAKIRALEEIERATQLAAGEAAGWVAGNASRLPGSPEPLSRAVAAPPHLEGLVEQLLGSDVQAFLVQDAACALDVALQAAERQVEGEVTLVLRDGRPQRDLLLNGPGAFSLIEELSFEPSAARAAWALLGDVVVCESLELALSLHLEDEGGHRFVTEDGACVWPSGKVTFGRQAPQDGEGALARVRRLEELALLHSQAKDAFEQAKKAQAQSEEAFSALQAESLSVSQQLAALIGKESSAKGQAAKAQERVEQLTAELASIAKQHAEALAAVEKAQPDVDSLEAREQELSHTLEELRVKSAQLADEIAPLRQAAGKANEALNQAKLEAARQVERQTYNRRMLDTRSRALEDLESTARQSAQALSVKTVAIQRLRPLEELFDQLSQSAQRRMAVLEDMAREAQDSSTQLQVASQEARQASRAARENYESLSQRLADLRVEKGRLELQVQSAINVIVEDCRTPLEFALGLPALEDRSSVEQEEQRLSKRIAGLGAINPEAAQEFSALKERYDYLMQQVGDLESARRSLARINRVIDARMKNDFQRTFDEVNANFQEVFSVLFPGGTAHLSLTDPDDVDNSGVEVNAQPRGKRITKMTLMSGGEKSLTALALLFALYRTRPTPFYILDEVEAALDDTNLRRLIAYIDQLRTTTQLIMITHQRRTMEMADVLFGVSMQADGITKVISQKLDRALEYAE